MNLRLPFISLLLLTAAARAQLTIPSDGSDGAFNPTANIEVDLSQAVTGTWNAASSIPGKGIYDPNKWAIVFKYSSVNIPVGVTVTFKNHPSNPPVVWLVQGGVNIAGTVSVNSEFGKNGVDSIYPSNGGPGGGRGGVHGQAGSGVGLGIGGGWVDQEGAYSTSYGNPQIIPLIGGSGGGGRGSDGANGGNGGAGAILIAAGSSLSLGGSITARDANLGVWYGRRGGSGGAIRLIANEVTGGGQINADNNGRVRIESNLLSPTLVTTPPTIAVPPGTTPVIFQADNAPTVRIVSVDGLPSPIEPTAPLITSADIGIEKNTPVTIILETRNFPTAGSVVSVRRAVKFGGFEWQNATFVSGNNALATWQVSMTFTPGFNTLQARATAP